MHKAYRSLSLCLALAAVSCGDQSESYLTPSSLLDAPVALDGKLVFVDSARHEAFLLDAAPANPGNIVLAMAVEPAHHDAALLAAKPLTPVADPGTSTFLASITVELESPTSGAKIYYTEDSTTPTAASPEYKSTTVLTFTKTTLLKAVGVVLSSV